MRLRPVPSQRRFALLLTGLLALGPVSPAGRAAEIVPYDVTITPTGNAAVDDAVQQTSSLIGLRDKARVGPFALVLRAREDLARLQAAMGSQGYYAGTATITVAGRALEDPALPDLLEAMPQGERVPVVASLRLGPAFSLGRVTVNGGPPPPALGLTPGAPARAADVLAAQTRLLAALRSDGYALATVADPAATLDAIHGALDIDFAVSTGPRVAIGRVSIAGLERVDPEFARTRLGLKPGERFDPARLAKAQQDLLAAGTFSSVVVEAGTQTDPDGTLPVRVQVQERPLHVVNLGAAFSTDQGGSASASWTHRNLFGGAEQLGLSAAVTGLGGSANEEPGYALGAVLTVPDWLRRDQTLTVSLNAFREFLRAYDRTGGTLAATASRPLWPHWTASLGLAVTQEQVVQEAVARDYSLLQVTAGLKYDSSDDLLDPKHGIRAALTLTPTVSFGGVGQANFLIGQASASTYVDLSGTGRTILAGRVLLGAILGAGPFDVPPDQRFYGGGSGTIRGFRYQSVGPLFPSGRPQGGTSVDAASIELRQRFLESWGAVAFVDAGQVSEDGVFSGPIRVGAGAGVRYYTVIGPVRLDLAVPLNRQKKDDAFELYIGLGHAF